MSFSFTLLSSDEKDKNINTANNPNDYNPDDNQPKKSSLFGDGVIHITFDNWSDAPHPNIKVGAGTYDNPHKIENATIDGGGRESGIFIESSTDYFIIKNCTITNIGSEYTYDAGIRLRQSSNGRIMKNFCENSTSGNGILISGGGNNNITDNECHNNRNGILIIDSSNNKIYHNDCDHNGYYGIWLSGSSSTNNNVSWNTVNYGLEGIRLASCRHNIVSYNTANYHGDCGFKISSCFFNNITGNSMNRNHDHGIYLKNSDYNNIIGNTAYRNNWYLDSGIYVEDSHYNNISNNIFTDNIDHGIYVESSHHNTIQGNEIYDNDNHGIYVESSHNNTIQGNEIYDNDIHGIYLNDNCKDINVNNNKVFSNIQEGIYLSTSCIENNISNNRVFNNQIGIHLESSNNNRLFNNNLTDNNIYGIYIDGCQRITLDENKMNGTYLEISNTTIEEYSSHSISSTNLMENKAIYYYGSKKSLELSNLNNIGQVILANCSDSSLSNLILNDCLRSIILFHCNNITISNSEIRNTHKPGIYIYYSNKCFFEGNTIKTFYNRGIIAINSDNNTFSKNNISNNDKGIFLYKNCNNNLFCENNITSNEFGIHIKNNCLNNNITKNDILSNSKSGIFIEGYDSGIYPCQYNSISENFIFNNTEHGIHLYYCYNSEIGAFNNISSNKINGIYIQICGSINISNNKIDNNYYNIRLINGDALIIVENIINSSLLYGIHMTFSSQNNLIYLNNLTNNVINAYDSGFSNNWDNTTIGNYWDDYSGYDCDGDFIGETAYIFGYIIDNYPICYRYDDIKPIIEIIDPKEKQNIGRITPEFYIFINEYLLDYSWYTLDGGITNYTFVGSFGTINKTAWHARWIPLLDGDIFNITFYAKDIAGNIGFAIVNITKYAPPVAADDDDGKKVESDLTLIYLIILGSSVVGIIATIVLIRKKFKKKT